MKRGEFDVKILVVTGSLAEEMVRRRVEESGVEASVVVMPVKVAALIPPKLISQTLREMDLRGVKLILVPGLLPGDVSRMVEEVGVQVFKGPKNAADLPHILKLSEKLTLSTTTPACDLIRDVSRRRAEEDLKTIYRKAGEAAVGRVIPIGSGGSRLLVGRRLPPVVLAEIVDAPLLEDERIGEAARYFARSGADIIDIGMIPGGGNPTEARRAVHMVKKVASTPVSIDTIDLEEMEAAVDAGVDLILSLNGETLREAEFAHNHPVVITPAAPDGSCPTAADDKTQSLEKNVSEAIRLGFKKIIADPILTPLLTPNLTESLASYRQFARRNPETPLLFGAGNVTELVDADSLGVNLLLAGMGLELEASILLTTEASSKTRGCVKELSTALKMMLLAGSRGSPPKDLGLNLLVLKDKASLDEEPPLTRGQAGRFTREKAYPPTLDPKGYFKIMLDRGSGEIQLAHYPYKGEKPDVVITGGDPLNLCKTAIHLGLISTLDHASYLGVEIYKAHLALATGKNYVQERPLFNP